MALRANLGVALQVIGLAALLSFVLLLATLEGRYLPAVLVGLGASMLLMLLGRLMQGATAAARSGPLAAPLSADLVDALPL